MDVHENVIGVYPNIALTPGTNRHAATGEPVVIPEWARVDYRPDGNTYTVRMADCRGDIPMEAWKQLEKAVGE